MKSSRVVVFQTAFLGDAVLAVPLLKSVRNTFSGAQLAFVCRRGTGDFFRAAMSSGNPLVDRVIEVNKDSSEDLKKAFVETAAFKPDVVVSPHRSFRTALWVWRLHAAMSVGFRDVWSLFAYKKRIKRQEGLHDVRRQLSLMAAFENAKTEESLRVDLPSSNEFAALKGAVVLAPGSQWSSKRWTEEGFAAVGNHFRSLGKGVVIVGANSEAAICARVARIIPGAVDLCGKTNVLQLAQLLRDAALLVSNDSGAMHVATAVGTPVVAAFGPTVPEQGYAPWGSNASVAQISMSCRPCGAHGHTECPLKHHDCMKKLQAKDVVNLAEELLRGAR